MLKVVVMNFLEMENFMLKETKDIGHMYRTKMNTDNNWNLLFGSVLMSDNKDGRSLETNMKYCTEYKNVSLLSAHL